MDYVNSYLKCCYILSLSEKTLLLLLGKIERPVVYQLKILNLLLNHKLFFMKITQLFLS